MWKNSILYRFFFFLDHYLVLFWFFGGLLKYLFMGPFYFFGGKFRSFLILLTWPHYRKNIIWITLNRHIIPFVFLKLSSSNRLQPLSFVIPLLSIPNAMNRSSMTIDLLSHDRLVSMLTGFFSSHQGDRLFHPWMHLFYFFRLERDWISFLIKSLFLCRSPHTIC